MDTQDEIFNQFPEESQKTIRQVWEAIPEKERSSLISLIEQLPTKSNLWKLLIKLTGDQVKLTMGRKQRIAIVGPANVGKSTLYNQFIQSAEDKAEVSAVPGTTRDNQEATAGLFSVIDTPGADAAGSLGEVERKKALDAAEQADFLIIIFDAIQGIKQSEVELFGTLQALKKPFIVVLNKIDLVRKDLPGIKQNAAKNLHLEPNQVISISAKDASNLSGVLTAIISAEPEIVAALGKALPQYRWHLAWRVIVSAASLSGVIALTPLPMIDFIPLIVNQSSMVLGIARIYNYKIDFKRARELVVTFSLAYLGRTLFYELSKLGGIPGWILAAAIAASTTVAMGFAAAQWFERGEKLTGEQLKELTRKVTDLLLNSLKQIRSQKDRKKIQEQIEVILTDSDLGEKPDLPEDEDENNEALIK